MQDSANYNDQLTEIEDKPKVQELIDDFKTCSPWADNTWNRVTDNENVRFMIWPGQFPDGKKHNTGTRKAFPWDGASDVRIPLADATCNENVAICCAAFWRAMIRPKAGVTQGSDYAVKLADYFINTLLYDEIFREVELSEQYRQTIGWVALHPVWQREISLYRRKVTLEQLMQVSQGVQQAQQGNGTNTTDTTNGIANLPQLITDPSSEDAAVEAFAQLYEIYAKSQVEDVVDVELPPLAKTKIRKAVKELRAAGETDVPLPCVVKNQPTVIALKPYDEFFVPPTCTEVQRTARCYRRFWMSEIELKTRIMTEGWSKEWVEEALKHKGEYSTWAASTLPVPPPESLNTAMSLQSSSWMMVRQNEKLVEVIYAYYHALDADNVPGVYMTVFHPSVARDPNKADTELYATHGLIDAPKGQVPFVTGQRENWSRNIVMSRGVPQVVTTWQREVKVQRDALIDHTSLAVTPPVLVPKGAMGADLLFGPAKQNEITPGREPKFMEVPSPGAPISLQLIQTVNAEVDEYFGRMAQDVLPARVTMKQQMLVQPFLLMWSKALQQMIMLAQTYMPDAEFSRVTGAPPGWLDNNRNSFGAMDVELHFDVRELDPEWIQKQFELMNQFVLPGDAGGVVDRSKLTAAQMRMFSPALAKDVVAEQQTATQQIFRQVKAEIAMMYLGNEAEYVQMDPTAETKLKFAQQIVQGNPNYQQALGSKGRFAELMQKYTQNLQFSLTEQQNKQVGAIGVRPQMQQPAGQPAGQPQGTQTT